MTVKTAAETNIDRVYVYHGADDVQKRASLDRLISETVEPGMMDFDLETLSGPDVTADRLLLAASVAPFLSKKRMVIVNQANDILSSEQEILAGKLDNIPDTACVVFITPAPRIQDGKPKKGSEISSELMKAVKKVGKAVDFPLMKTGPAIQYVKGLLKETGKSAAPAVAESIVRRAGTDSGVLITEVEKLRNYTGDRMTITEDDVEQAVSQTIEEKIFEMMDAVGAKDTKKALQLLRPFFIGAGSPDGEALKILVMLARHFRQLWQARMLLDSGYRAAGNMELPPQIESQFPKDFSVLKMDDWKQKKIFSQARNFTIDELASCFERIAAVDLALKGIDGAVVDAAMAMDVLIIELSARQSR